MYELARFATDETDKTRYRQTRQIEYVGWHDLFTGSPSLVGALD